jgi:hypothetical protein
LSIRDFSTSHDGVHIPDVDREGPFGSITVTANILVLDWISNLDHLQHSMLRGPGGSDRNRIMAKGIAGVGRSDREVQIAESIQIQASGFFDRWGFSRKLGFGQISRSDPEISVDGGMNGTKAVGHSLEPASLGSGVVRNSNTAAGTGAQISTAFCVWGASRSADIVRRPVSTGDKIERDLKIVHIQ